MTEIANSRVSSKMRNMFRTLDKYFKYQNMEVLSDSISWESKK
jgi:hypothetical protein